MRNKKRRKLIIGFVCLAFALIITVVALEYLSNYKISKTIHTNAPVITMKTITINAPVEKVWKIFRDVNRWNTWQKEIVNPEINGEFTEGTTFNWKSNGLNITSTLQTVEVNRKVGWSGPAFGSFAIHTWYFSEQNGQTIVKVEESMEGWLVRLLRGRFQSGLDTSIEYWLGALKTEAEK